MPPELSLFLRSLLVGFAMAVPVGPVNVLCMRRTLSGGLSAGLMSGLGAALADGLYGFVGGFGVTLVLEPLMRYQRALRLAGGGLLCVLGLRSLMHPPEPGVEAPQDLATRAGHFSSTFLLTLTNPTTIFTFAAVFAGIGLGTAQRTPGNGLAIFLGVLAGSGLWWLCLALGVDRLRSRFSTDTLRRIYQVAGLVVLGMGTYFVLSAVAGGTAL